MSISMSNLINQTANKQIPSGDGEVAIGIRLVVMADEDDSNSLLLSVSRV